MQTVLGLPVAATLAMLGFRNYMNDSLRTDVFVRFQPESIACACIYLAARTLEVSALLPWLSRHLVTFVYLLSCSHLCQSCLLQQAVLSCLKSFVGLEVVEKSVICCLCSQIPLPNRPHWFLLFGATEEEIQEICLKILQLYTRKKVL